MPWIIGSPTPSPTFVASPDTTPILPQIDAPFRIDTNGHVVVVEQDTPAEIGAAVYNIVSCPQGAAQNDPTFGIPSPLFGPLDVDTDGIVNAVQALEPRATVEVVQQTLADLRTADLQLNAAVDG